MENNFSKKVVLESNPDIINSIKKNRNSKIEVNLRKSEKLKKIKLSM